MKKHLKKLGNHATKRIKKYFSTPIDTLHNKNKIIAYALIAIAIGVILVKFAIYMIGGLFDSSSQEGRVLGVSAQDEQILEEMEVYTETRYTDAEEMKKFFDSMMNEDFGAVRETDKKLQEKTKGSFPGLGLFMQRNGEKKDQINSMVTTYCSSQPDVFSWEGKDRGNKTYVPFFDINVGTNDKGLVVEYQKNAGRFNEFIITLSGNIGLEQDTKLVYQVTDEDESFLSLEDVYDVKIQDSGEIEITFKNQDQIPADDVTLFLQTVEEEPIQIGKLYPHMYFWQSKNPGYLYDLAKEFGFSGSDLKLILSDEEHLEILFSQFIIQDLTGGPQGIDGLRTTLKEYFNTKSEQCTVYLQEKFGTLQEEGEKKAQEVASAEQEAAGVEQSTIKSLTGKTGFSDNFIAGLAVSIPIGLIYDSAKKKGPLGDVINVAKYVGQTVTKKLSGVEATVPAQNPFDIPVSVPEVDPIKDTIKDSTKTNLGLLCFTPSPQEYLQEEFANQLLNTFPIPGNLDMQFVTQAAGKIAMDKIIVPHALDPVMQCLQENGCDTSACQTPEEIMNSAEFKEKEAEIEAELAEQAAEMEAEMMSEIETQALKNQLDALTDDQIYQTWQKIIYDYGVPVERIMDILSPTGVFKISFLPLGKAKEEWEKLGVKFSHVEKLVRFKVIPKYPAVYIESGHRYEAIARLVPEKYWEWLLYRLDLDAATEGSEENDSVIQELRNLRDEIESLKQPVDNLYNTDFDRRINRVDLERVLNDLEVIKKILEVHIVKKEIVYDVNENAASFEMKLDVKPEENVQIDIMSDGSLVDTLIFDSENWNVAQRVVLENLDPDFSKEDEVEIEIKFLNNQQKNGRPKYVVSPEKETLVLTQDKKYFEIVWDYLKDSLKNFFSLPKVYAELLYERLLPKWDIDSIVDITVKLFAILLETTPFTPDDTQTLEEHRTPFQHVMPYSLYKMAYWGGEEDWIEKGSSSESLDDMNEEEQETQKRIFKKDTVVSNFRDIFDKSYIDMTKYNELKEIKDEKQSDYDDLQSKIENITNDIQFTAGLKGEYEDALEVIGQNFPEMEQAIGECKQEINEKKAQLASISSTDISAELAKYNLELEIENLEIECEQNQEDFDQKESDKAEYESKLTEASEELERLNTEIETLESQVPELESLLTEAIEKLEKEAENIEVKKQEVQVAKKEVQTKEEHEVEEKFIEVIVKTDLVKNPFEE